MIALVVLLCGAVEPLGVDVALPTAGGATRLNVTVTVDGVSPETAWAAFLDKVFDHFDLDGDGALSPAETGRVFPLPLPDGREVKADFASLDSDKNGKGNKGEFRDFYRQAGFAPVVAVVRPPSAEHHQLSAAFFHHLDRDRNGTVSAEEWNQAPNIMRRLDENEDERLDAAELLVNGPQTKTATPATRLKVAVATAQPDTRLRIELGEKPVARLDANEVGLKHVAGNTLEVPGGRMRLSFGRAKADSGFRTAREFYLAQFAEASGKKPALTRDEVEADPGLTAVAGMFPFADRNGDGQLVVGELRAFLELVELGLECQTLVVIEDRGANLFDLLDENADGRLDVAELKRSTGFRPVEVGTLPAEYRLSVSRGPVGKAFGPVPVPAAKPATAALPQRYPNAPAWFRAMDRNGDGFVSAVEFRGPPEQFTRLDADKDGRISVSEAEAAVR
jgi:Ca2+-binding EF-hand superfamily protein